MTLNSHDTDPVADLDLSRSQVEKIGTEWGVFYIGVTMYSTEDLLVHGQTC